MDVITATDVLHVGNELTMITIIKQWNAKVGWVCWISTHKKGVIVPQKLWTGEFSVLVQCVVANIIGTDS